MKAKVLLGLVLGTVACASRPVPPPYPAYIDVNELPDAFVASLPGVRAKQLSTDPRTQRVSYRLAVPPDWSFTTGGSPIHSVEIYVLAGQVEIGEFSLGPGGYFFIPPGMPGAQMRSGGGAVMLYFLDEADQAASIQTPIISSSDLIEWRQEDVGIRVKDLRLDPGSGARTWLMHIDQDAVMPYQQSSQIVEGYLLAGSMMYSECSGGMAGTDEYLPGGYFHRPPGAVHAGPDTQTTAGATWYLRTPGEEKIEFVDGCPPQ
jgi:quercetin dioxygenase-like cupin family protein